MMQQSSLSNKLWRHRDDLAPLHLSQIKSVMHPECEVNRPSESTKQSDVSFPDMHPKTTRPELVLYHPSHLSPIWVIVRAQPPCHQSPVFGPTLWVKTWGLTTDTEPGFCSPVDSAGIFLLNHESESTLCNQPSLHPLRCKKLGFDT